MPRRLLLLLLLLSLAPLGASAQNPGTGGPAPQDPTDPTAVPLDGGAGLLLASGLALGLRHLRKRANK